MKGKSKLLFLICTFALTFMLVVNVKADTVDCDGSKWTSGEWTSYSSGTSISGSTSAPTCSTTGTSYTQYEVLSPGSNECGSNISTGCHRSRSWTRTNTSTLGSTCCDIAHGTTISDESGCAQCGANCVAGACPTVTITCKTVTYSGNQQTLATCSGGSITSNEKVTNAGTYTVKCSATNGYTVSESCTMSKANGSISNFANFTMTKGESKALSATGTGTITYSTVGGNSVLLDGEGVSAIATGTTTIRATSAATTNYKQATKDITITVTEASTTGVCCCTSDKSTCGWMSQCTSSQPTAIQGATEANCKDNEEESEEQETCPTGKYLDEDNQCVDCNDPKQYKVGNKCITCTLDGYKATTADPYCHMVVAAGSYLVQAGGSSTQACAPGTWSAGKKVKEGDAFTCTNCPAGKTSPLGAKSESECYEKETETNCTITASTNEVRVSYGDYYNVHVTVSGKGCNGLTMTLTPVRGTLPASNKGTYTVYDGSGFNFTMQASYQSTCTSDSSLTAKLSNGKSSTASVTTIRSWHLSQDNVCRTTAQLASSPLNGVNSRQAAEEKPQDTYYIVQDASACNGSCGSNRCVDIWVRGCGTTGGGPDPKPACYLQRSTGQYIWGEFDSDPEHYTKITSITVEKDCVTPEETPYCYKLITDGTYHWGKYKDDENYELIDTSITQENCNTPEEGENPACYINVASGEYVWGKYQDMVAYSLVASITEKDKCVNPGKKCYKNKTSGEYVWGIYDEELYDVVEGITEKKKCKVACYKCADDEYKWGTTVDYPDCELVPNITTQDSCKPVPVTGSSVSKIIYAISLFLIMAGSGIVVYQLTKTKRELN